MTWKTYIAKIFWAASPSYVHFSDTSTEMFLKSQTNEQTNKQMNLQFVQVCLITLLCEVQLKL